MGHWAWGRQCGETSPRLGGLTALPPPCPITHYPCPIPHYPFPIAPTWQNTCQDGFILCVNFQF
ncbi:MAG: hypothetical protein KME31_07460 [Tolypothrix carrinoi HA7290-LM1]|nr:hypothetical protein [Tolypothrix carrinoi HA7290-LM1]